MESSTWGAAFGRQETAWQALAAPEMIILGADVSATVAIGGGEVQKEQERCGVGRGSGARAAGGGSVEKPRGC